jgi:ferric-dicitrate binding protein FerR (iron transport regulator)
MGQGGVGSDAGIPIKAAPPAPARQGFNRLSLASAAAIAAFLPRQRTPQEVGGQEYMSALQNQRDSILNDASKTDAQKSAATQAYMTGLERIIQLNQAGILNAETQGFGVPP